MLNRPYVEGSVVVWWAKDANDEERKTFIESLGLEILIEFGTANRAVVRVPIGEESSWIQQLIMYPEIIENALLNYEE